MAPATFTSPFPKLDLSLDEKENLHNTATSLVDEAKSLYEDYMSKTGSHLDAAKWECIRESENVKVYRDRRRGAGTDNKDMHLLLTAGTMPGTLHDAMYGVMCNTTDDIRVKAAYVGDPVVDMAVLDTIIEPTPEQPFESMMVRWMARKIPFHARALLKHQDCISFEATGLRALTNGETVGFHLVHSVKFAKTPELPNYGRINISFCGLYRQISSTRVEAFMVSYFEIKDSLLVSTRLKALADSMVSISHVIECGQQKKLAFLVQHKDTFVLDHDNDSQGGADGCAVCGSRDRSAYRGVKSACAICSRHVCDGCRLKRDLWMFALDRELLKHNMRLCVPCVATAQRIDAATIAGTQAELKRGRDVTKIKNVHCVRVTRDDKTAASWTRSSSRGYTSATSSLASLDF